MTSSINPSNIDGTFPIAGQDNDSQGFRDNFTNTGTNFTAAKAEIEDLQSKVVLKAALDGESLDNDGGGSLIRNFEVRDMGETVVAQGSTTGAVVFDYSAGPYQTVTSSGSLSFSFTNWPASGTYGKMRVAVTISNTAHTVTLPSAVSVGTANIAGYASNVITFDALGTYVLEFSTADSGSAVAITDLSRAGRLADQRTPASVGVAGDVAGMIAVDASFIYVCTGDYDGSTAIWSRAAISAF